MHHAIPAGTLIWPTTFSFLTLAYGDAQAGDKPHKHTMFDVPDQSPRPPSKGFQGAVAHGGHLGPGSAFAPVARRS